MTRADWLALVGLILTVVFGIPSIPLFASGSAALGAAALDAAALTAASLGAVAVGSFGVAVSSDIRQPSAASVEDRREDLKTPLCFGALGTAKLRFGRAPDDLLGLAGAVELSGRRRRAGSRVRLERISPGRDRFRDRPVAGRLGGLGTRGPPRGAAGLADRVRAWRPPRSRHPGGTVAVPGGFGRKPGSRARHLRRRRIPVEVLLTTPAAEIAGVGPAFDTRACSRGDPTVVRPCGTRNAEEVPRPGPCRYS